MGRSLGELGKRIAHLLLPLSETPRLDAQVLLGEVCGRGRAWVLAHPEATLSAEAQIRLEAALQRLERGEPLPYVLGHWEFFGLDFALTPAALIPRPETEGLVERALAWLQSRGDCRLAADVGTGCGCIAISLAVHRPSLRLLATDLSMEALRLAQQNAKAHGVSERIDLIQADLLPPCQVELICANLPYIPSHKLKALPIYGREPSLALDGGADGLEAIRRLLAQAPSRLKTGGLMLLEIEATQGKAALELAQAAFPRARIRLHQDLAGLDRLIEVSLFG